ncbi:MAG: hypothetical protein ACREJ5_07815 [Geminicoccaceae bacterium]
MATMLRPSDSYTSHRTIVLHPACDGPPLGSGANAARRFERTCHVLAQLIDTSLTAVFLVAGVAQAVLLLLMLAGQTLS